RRFVGYRLVQNVRRVSVDSVKVDFRLTCAICMFHVFSLNWHRHLQRRPEFTSTETTSRMFFGWGALSQSGFGGHPSQETSKPGRGRTAERAKRCKKPDKRRGGGWLGGGLAGFLLAKRPEPAGCGLS